MTFPAGPDVVQVYPEVEVEDSYGNPVLRASDNPITVRGCHVQPASSTESAALGQTTETLYRCLSRTFPGGPFARVEWDGRSWDVLGTPKRQYRAHHYTTMLRAR